MENTPKNTPKKTPKASYLDFFNKLNKSHDDERCELRADGTELYVRGLDKKTLIASDVSREERRQAAVVLIQAAIENDFRKHGLDMIPMEELVSVAKHKAGVTLQSPVTLGEFNKLHPVVVSFTEAGDGFQTYMKKLKPDPNSVDLSLDVYQIAYKEGQANSEENLQRIQMNKSSFNYVDAIKLYAALGLTHEEDILTCRKLGALEIYIRKEVASLYSPALEKSWNEFCRTCEHHGGKHLKLTQYHGSPTGQQSLPISLLGAYAEMSIEGGLISLVNNLNRKIEAGKKEEFTESNPYFDNLEELKRKYLNFELVADLPDLKGKRCQDISDSISNFKKNKMLVLHTSNHTMAAGFSQYRGEKKYWFLDPANGLAVFSTAKVLGDFLAEYLDAGSRCELYGMMKSPDGIHVNSVDELVKQNVNFGTRKNEFIAMLGLTVPSSLNLSVGSTSSSATESVSTKPSSRTTTSTQTTTSTRPTTSSAMPPPKAPLKVTRTTTTSTAEPTLTRSLVVKRQTKEGIEFDDHDHDHLDRNAQDHDKHCKHAQEGRSERQQGQILEVNRRARWTSVGAATRGALNAFAATFGDGASKLGRLQSVE